MPGKLNTWGKFERAYDVNHSPCPLFIYHMGACAFNQYRQSALIVQYNGPLKLWQKHNKDTKVTLQVSRDFSIAYWRGFWASRKQLSIGSRIYTFCTSSSTGLCTWIIYNTVQTHLFPKYNFYGWSITHVTTKIGPLAIFQHCIGMSRLNCAMKF